MSSSEFLIDHAFITRLLSPFPLVPVSPELITRQRNLSGNKLVALSW